MKRLLPVIGLAAITAAANAWNATGHMVIAAIAEGDLRPEVASEANRLLAIGGTPTTSTFLTAAVWADDLREPRSAPWHYINYHFRTDRKRTTNQPEKENVEVAIERFRAILGDRSRPDAERAEALRFVLHFVGDVHQPLHAVARDSDEHPTGDRGGNDFKIRPPLELANIERAPNNLHSLWDLGAGLFPFAPRPLSAENESRVRVQALTLRAALPRRAFRRVGDANPSHWARESLDAAKRTVYALSENEPPSPEYMQAARVVAAQRATLAGYRLADVLNGALGTR